MTLERGIAVVFLIVCIVYGYTAFVTMQNELLPFELNMAFLPNSLPKVLSVLGIIVALVIIFTSAPSSEASVGQLELSKLDRWNIIQAVGLLVAMAAYALLLRPLGFIGSTTLFIVFSAMLLGERKLHFLIPIALFASFIIWFLVERMLEIVLRPWPWFIAG